MVPMRYLKGGIISGGKIEVDFGPCECGAHTPSIRDNIVRYSDRKSVGQGAAGRSRTDDDVVVQSLHG